MYLLPSPTHLPTPNCFLTHFKCTTVQCCWHQELVTLQFTRSQTCHRYSTFHSPMYAVQSSKCRPHLSCNGNAYSSLIFTTFLISRWTQVTLMTSKNLPRQHFWDDSVTMIHLLYGLSLVSVQRQSNAMESNDLCAEAQRGCFVPGTQVQYTNLNPRYVTWFCHSHVSGNNVICLHVVYTPLLLYSTTCGCKAFVSCLYCMQYSMVYPLVEILFSTE